MDTSLSIRVRHYRRHVLVTVAGEIDVATAAHLRGRLTALPARGRPVVADLSGVSFIDAAGLGVLASVARQARAQGTSLHVVSPGLRLRRLFIITGLHKLIPLARTLDAALAALPPAGGSGPAGAI
jgi:anti-sigma B factor antagonist